MNKQLQDCAMSTRDESKSTFRLSIITFNWSMIEQLNRLTLRHYLKVFNGAFLILFFLNGNSIKAVNITTAVVWDALNPPTSGYDIGGITIKPGGSLTIDGITLSFDPGAGITVEAPTTSPTSLPGGFLIITNAVLQSKTTGNRWLGITVTGLATEDQYTTVTSKSKPYLTSKWEGVLNSNQSRVIAKGSTFINAYYGISSISGGIVRVSESCQFTNCETGIKITYYTSPTNPDYNACYIMNTTFTWTRTFINPSSLPFVGINLQELGGGINIGGCIFQNNDASAYSYNDRGTGILATNVDFNLSKGGDIYCEDATDEGCLNNCNSSTGAGGNGNIFKKLSYGVNYSGGNHHQMAIRNSTFENVLYSIKVVNAVSTAIAKNIFTHSFDNGTTNDFESIFITSPTTPPSPRKYDVYLSGSKDATVYKNDFTFYNDCNWQTSTIIADQTGTTNSSIKSNVMSITHGLCRAGLSSEVNGIEVLHTCPGLEILCNEFTEYGVDIRVRSTGVLGDFGTVINSKPGKNKFSAPYSSSRTSLYIHGGATIGMYYYNLVAVGNNEIPSTNSPANILMNSSYLAGDCSISCGDLLALGIFNVGILSNNQIINVFPNPNQGSFDFEIKNVFKFGYLRIYNELAQQINETQLNTKQLFGINLENQPSGIYTLVFLLDDKSPIIKKVVINK